MRTLICWFIVFGAVLPTGLVAQGKELRVAFIAPFSGPAQSYGDAARNGFELALREIDRGKIHVIYEDDQFTPAKTVAAFQKITQSESVDVVICIGSAPCNSVAPLAESKHIPLVGYASDPTVSRNRRFVIRSYPSGQEEGRRTAQEALTRNFSRIGVITSIHDYTLSWREGLVSILSPKVLILDEQVPPELMDFKPLLLKARQKGVESFLICAVPGQSGNFARQSRELGFKSKIGGCYFLEDENEAKLAKGALDGAWYIIASVSPEFAVSYKLRYGNENAITGAAVHYDIAKILALISAQDHSTEIVKYLMGISAYNGAAGRVSARDDDGDRYLDYQLATRSVKF